MARNQLKLTDALKRANVPDLYAGEKLTDEQKQIPVKVFDPCGRGTWYVLEWDRTDTMFVYCQSPLGSDCDELAYASVSELESVRNRLGLHLEVDRCWDKTTTLATIKQRIALTDG